MNNPTTKLSILYQGSWSFATPTQEVVKTEKQSIYRIDYKFGLVKQNEELPNKITQIGNKGDYVSLDPAGVMSLMTASEYKRIYKKVQNKEPLISRSSKNLRDPNFLTKVLQESPTSSYNRPIPKNL
jgi:hypothetical protein